MNSGNYKKYIENKLANRGSSADWGDDEEFNLTPEKLKRQNVNVSQFSSMPILQQAQPVENVLVSSVQAQASNSNDYNGNYFNFV